MSSPIMCADNSKFGYGWEKAVTRLTRMVYSNTVSLLSFTFLFCITAAGVVSCGGRN